MKLYISMIEKRLSFDFTILFDTIHLALAEAKIAESIITQTASCLGFMIFVSN